MGHFLGSVEGSRGEASRLGSKKSGLHVTAAGWGGAIKVHLGHVDGKDTYRVYLTPWQSSGGTSQLLAEGVLDSAATVEDAEARGGRQARAAGAG